MKFSLTQIIGLLILGVSSLIALWMMLQLLRFEMYPAHHGWDGSIYTAIGRAILNGLIPYRDLFEFKPPGMFLISGLSLYVFDDIRLGNILQGVVELGIFLMLLASVYRNTDLRKNSFQRLFLLFGTAVLASLLVQYLAERSGHFQSESFGSFFAIAYFLLLATEGRGRKFIFAAALLILGAIGIKETFTGAVIAGGLIILPPRIARRDFITPFVLALALGTISLAVLGYLPAYLNVYLPEMILGRASFNSHPLWAIGLLGRAVFVDVWDFSPALVISFAFLWCGSLVRSSEAEDPRTIQVSLGLGISFLLLYWLAGKNFYEAAVMQSGYTWGLLLSTASVVIAYSLLTVLIVRRILPYDARSLLTIFACHIAAFLIVIGMINIGGALQQQMGMIVTLFAALAINIFRPGGSYVSEWIRQNTYAAATIVSCVGIFMLPAKNYSSLLADRVTQDNEQRAVAARIDGLMQDCGYNRYLILGQANVPFAYTHHSPYGPTFNRPTYIFPVSWRRPPIPFIQETWRKNMREAPFAIVGIMHKNSKEVVLNMENIPKVVIDEFTDTMGTDPPPCAAKYPAPDDLVFFFRKDGAGEVTTTGL